jgi:hypothetical protein
MKPRRKAGLNFLCSIYFCTGLLWFGSQTQAGNFKFGPFDFTLGATAGFEYNDNVNSTETNMLSDVQLTIGPTLSGGIDMPFSGGQRFSLSMSFEYRKSLTGNQPDQFNAPVGASLTLPIQVGRWEIVAADAFSYRNDVLETTFGYNQNQTKQWNNTASLNATRRFGRYAITLAAQRLDTLSPDDPTIEEVQYGFSLTPSYYFRENYSVFLQNSVGLTYPVDPSRSDILGISSSVGVSGQITPALSGSISVGYAWNQIDPIIHGPGTGIFGGIFNKDITPGGSRGGGSSSIALSYAHPLRPNTTHSISIFRSPGVTALLKDSNIQETMGVTYSLAHRLNRYVTLTPKVGWTNTKDISIQGSGSGEVVDIIFVGMGWSRQLSRNLNLSFDYRFQTRASNLPGASYDVNRITGTLNYTF